MSQPGRFSVFFYRSFLDDVRAQGLVKLFAPVKVIIRFQKNGIFHENITRNINFHKKEYSKKLLSVIMFNFSEIQ